MSYAVKGRTIYLTRGDTMYLNVSPTYDNGDPYSFQEGDSVRFAMKKSILDEEPLLVKEIPIDNCILKLDPEDTKSLPFGGYVYDIQLTRKNGDVDTFIPKSNFILLEEVL